VLEPPTLSVVQRNSIWPPTHPVTGAPGNGSLVSCAQSKPSMVTEGGASLESTISKLASASESRTCSSRRVKSKYSAKGRVEILEPEPSFGVGHATEQNPTSERNRDLTTLQGLSGIGCANRTGDHRRGDLAWQFEFEPELAVHSLYWDL
jgi:hypothetical protein